MLSILRRNGRLRAQLRRLAQRADRPARQHAESADKRGQRYCRGNGHEHGPAQPEGNPWGHLRLHRQPRRRDRRVDKAHQSTGFPHRRRIIYGYDGVRDAFLTGKGKVTHSRANPHRERNPAASSIILTEIPYQVNKANRCTRKSCLLAQRKNRRHFSARMNRTATACAS